MYEDKQTILIVDDVPQNIKILGNLLKEDYRVIATSHGQEVMRLLKENRMIDLILLDIMMPDVDGYTLCKAIKRDEATSDIPVIFITSKDETHEELKGFEMGAVDYITKPFEPLIVKARVRTHAELKKLRDALSNIAYIDGLTAIPNKRKFDEYLDLYWQLAYRKQEDISLIMIDVDHFKLYNDHYGHLKGDDCLQEVAKVMQSVVRRGTDLLARYGGEEFACVLPFTGKNDALRLAEAIRSMVLNTQIPHEKSLVNDCVTISVGVASCIPEGQGDHEILIDTADQALYASKERGRNKVSYRAVRTSHYT